MVVPTKSQLKTSAVNSALLTTLIVTLIFVPSVQDPFNSPKLWVLILLAAWNAGYLLFRNIRFKEIAIHLKIISIIFLISIFIAGFVSQNKYTAFFGAYQRRDGVLAYLSLFILFLVLVVFIEFEYSNKVHNVILICAGSVGIYGFIQSIGADFVRWNNPYNAIIGTLGNPNFASALMAIFSSFLVVFSIAATNKYKIFYIGLVLLLLYNIVHSQSRQGLVAFGAGAGFALAIVIYKRSKIFGKIAFFTYLIIGGLAVAGMLQKGPLEPLLYKESVSIRGFYWRAAIEMFKAKPIFGVGFDSYGDYFKIYREVDYPLRYGFTITSTNAHSVPLQLFGTGGIFVGLSYVMLMIFAFVVSIKSIRKLQGQKMYFYIAIFGAWLAYQAQSIISIDSLGLAIWGWVLTGILIGLSFRINQVDSSATQNKVTRTSVFAKQRIISLTFLIVALIPISMLFQNEKNLFLLRAEVDHAIATNQISPDFIARAKSAINSPLQDPYHKSMIALYMANAGFLKEGLSALETISTQQPRDLDSLLNLAYFQEKSNLFKESLITRQKIAVLNPYNAANYLQLGRTFKYLGDYNSMDQMREKILGFASKTNEGKSAATELVR